MKKIAYILLFMLSFISNDIFAQEAARSDLLRSNGLIYVVLGVIVIIFSGLFIYLFVIDKKISKFEKKLKR